MWVRMRHPDIDATQRVTREAYDEVWAAKGWVLADDQQVPAVPTATEPVAEEATEQEE